MSAMPQLEGPPRGHFVDRDLAAEAVAMALPLLEAAMRHPEYGDSGFLHIVVMNPAATVAETRFEDAILYEHSIGDRARWDADYAAFARAKARLSWRFQEDSAVVINLRPHALREDDTLLWGSVWLDGIVVGVSGAFPCFDEAYSGIVAMCLRALAKRRAGRAATS